MMPNDHERTAGETVDGIPPVRAATEKTDDPSLITGTTEQPRTTGWFRRLWPPVTLVLLVACGVLLWWQQDAAVDWLRLRGYTPPAEIIQLGKETTMTPYATRLFYVNRPSVEEKASFNQHCPNASHEVAVLGCYRGDRSGIYMYKVTDPRLDGIVQVTAAHEMLHQAYDRLGVSERTHVNGLLVAYAKTVTDQTLKSKLEAYRKIEPNEMANEMHSLFGTEASNLPAELENYYKRYFVNREQVLDFYTQSRAAFEQREQQLKDYDAQLASLNSQITASRNKLKTVEARLQADRSQMESWLKAGQTDRYNAAVQGFNAQVVAYKQKVADANALINQYNSLIDKRNAIAIEEQELLKAQDSTAASSADTQ